MGQKYHLETTSDLPIHQCHLIELTVTEQGVPDATTAELHAEVRLLFRVIGHRKVMFADASAKFRYAFYHGCLVFILPCFRSSTKRSIFSIPAGFVSPANNWASIRCNRHNGSPDASEAHCGHILQGRHGVPGGNSSLARKKARCVRTRICCSG